MSHRPAPLSQSMTVNTFAAGVFAVVVSILAVVAPANAEDATVQNASWFGWGERTAAARCERGVDHFVEEMMEHAEEEVEFTSTQQAAWDDLIAAVRQGGSEVTTFCGKVDAARAADAAPATERLAMAEEAVAVGLKTIQTIRPAFDAFYNTLDAEQKEMLNGAANHRRRGWWH
ncbi:LTXXQ motif family protein [Rhodobiaceae bacterium]|nr:LTXXQ motif family protein [Rhodobiaceae bacterium]